MKVLGAINVGRIEAKHTLEPLLELCKDGAAATHMVTIDILQRSYINVFSSRSFSSFHFYTVRWNVCLAVGATAHKPEPLVGSTRTYPGVEPSA